MKKLRIIQLRIPRDRWPEVIATLRRLFAESDLDSYDGILLTTDEHSGTLAGMTIQEAADAD